MKELVLETSCAQVKNCRFQDLPDFKEENCRGWCQDYVWDGKSIPSKPEFFTDIQLKTILKKIPEALTKEELKSLEEKISNLFSYCLFLTSEKELWIPEDVIEILNKLKVIGSINDDKKFKRAYLLYADLRTKLRIFIQKAEV